MSADGAVVAVLVIDHVQVGLDVSPDLCSDSRDGVDGVQFEAQAEGTGDFEDR